MARYLSHRCACTRGFVATYRVEDAARGVRMASNRPLGFKPTTRAFRQSSPVVVARRSHARVTSATARTNILCIFLAHRARHRRARNRRQRGISHPRAIDANVFGTHERVTRARDGGD